MSLGFYPRREHAEQGRKNPGADTNRPRIKKMLHLASRIATASKPSKQEIERILSRLGYPETKEKTP
jgi:hypothetical protein